MIILDKLYAYMMNHFLPRDNFDPDKVYCTIDDRVVDCETWEQTNDNWLLDEIHTVVHTRGDNSISNPHHNTGRNVIILPFYFVFLSIPYTQ